MGTDLEETPTPVAPAYCPVCIRTAEAIALARSSGTLRVTTFHAVLSEDPEPWSAIAVELDVDGRRVTTRGATEDAAIYEALRALGVVA